MSELLEKIEETARFLKGKIDQEYPYGIILGSGLGKLTEEMDIHRQIPYRDVPHFAHATVAGHRGSLLFGALGGKNIIAMSGRFHYYEGYSMQEITFPVRVMKNLGVHTLFISNASGGMNPEFEVGDLMIINDHIYLHPEHPLRGPNEETLGPRFPNMHQAYDPQLVQKASRIAKENHIRCHQGVYVALQGPSFETPAEYKAFRVMGGDAVGMSTAPEVVVARHADIRVFAISVISDMGYPPEKADKVTLDMVLAKAAEAEPKMRKIIVQLLNEI